MSGFAQLVFLGPAAAAVVLVLRSPAPGRWRGFALAWAGLTAVVVLSDAVVTLALVSGILPPGVELLVLFLPLLQLAVGVLSLAAAGCAVAAMVSGRSPTALGRTPTA